MDLDCDFKCDFRLTDEHERSWWQRWRDPDIRTADAVFDSAFVVRGDPEPEILRILDERAREALLELRERVYAILITQTHLHVGRGEAVSTVRALREVVDALMRVGMEMTSCVRQRHGPYR